MTNITFQTNEQLWKIENAAASAGYRKTNDCYWAQIFRNEETGHEFSTSREENTTNDPAADLVAMLTPAEEVPAEEPADPAAEVFPGLVKAVNAEAELRKDGKRFYVAHGDITPRQPLEPMMAFTRATLPGAATIKRVPPWEKP